MEQQVDSLPSPAVPDFAGVLASLATPASAAPENKPARNKNDFGDDFGDGLEDDVATLSYESALRAHARYKPDHSAEWDLPRRIESTVALVAEEKAARARAAEQTAGAGTGKMTPARRMSQSQSVISGSDGPRRRASVTVRLSEAECAQLQQRAAEAGLTVSAYLRSCTFEAETLRAQVKAALVELRAARPAARAEKVTRDSWPRWLARLLPRSHFGRHVARA